MDVIDLHGERRYRALLDDIREEFPGFRLIPKRASLLQRSISLALAVLTLGAQRRYMSHYVTTIGRSVYVHDGWDERDATERWITLRHERVHLRQFRRWTLPLMGLLYLAFPLPVGLAWARMRFERPAYEESIRAAAEAWGRSFVCNPEYRDYIVAQFVSGAYGWMWPFRRAVERWYDGIVAAL